MSSRTRRRRPGSSGRAPRETTTRAVLARHSGRIRPECRAKTALLTGRENLVLIGRLLRMPARAARKRAGELLERFGLGDAADRRVVTYSGGMRRRLDLAASLLATPPIVFLDEPTTGLDPSSRRELWSEIRHLVDEGATILLTTQYLEEADHLADRVAVLGGGRVVAEGTPTALKRKIGDERLTVTIPDPVHRERALSLIDERRPQLEGSALTVPIQQPDQIRLFLNDLADNEVVVEAVSLSAPTLDDVFFSFAENGDVAR